MNDAWIESAAKAAHEANRAYCEALGDVSQVPWGAAPEWQRTSVISGVRFLLEHPEAGPTASHESWLEEKRRDGWSYGEVKDVSKKQHPCFVRYADLPPAQQAKDAIFGAVVRGVIAQYRPDMNRRANATAALMREAADALDQAAARKALLERALRPFALAVERLPDWITDKDEERDIGRINYDAGITVRDLRRARAAVATTMVPDRVRELLCTPGVVEQAALDGKLDEHLSPALFKKPD